MILLINSISKIFFAFVNSSSGFNLHGFGLLPID